MTVNAIADEASKADRPTMAAATWTSFPDATAIAEVTPERRPWLRLLVTT